MLRYKRGPGAQKFMHSSWNGVILQLSVTFIVFEQCLQAYIIDPLKTYVIYMGGKPQI